MLTTTTHGIVAEDGDGVVGYVGDVSCQALRNDVGVLVEAVHINCNYVVIKIREMFLDDRM